MGRSGDVTGLKPSPLLKISLLSSSTFHIMTNIRSQLRCGPNSSPAPTFWPPALFPSSQVKPSGLIPFHRPPFLPPPMPLSHPLPLPSFPASPHVSLCLCTPFSLPLLLSGLPECSGADYQLCPWHVVPLASGAACAVHLRPHGIFTEHQWPHRLCHSGGEVGEIRVEVGVCAV